MGAEDEEESSEDDSMDGDVIPYDEIDSSKTINEEVEALILQKPSHILIDPVDTELGDDGDDDGVHIIGTHVESYTGYDFSPHVATSGWMEWDAASYI
jgi:hypothetical protein